MQKETFRIFGIPVYERQLIDTGPLDDPAQRFRDALYGKDTISGISISEEGAQTISAVWRAVSVVAGTKAFLPLQVHRKERDGDREYLPDHPVQEVLDYPNEDHTGYYFREMMQAFKMMWGNAYAVIRRNPATGYPIELIPVHPANCEPVKTDFGILYQVRTERNRVDVLAKDMLHFPGMGFDGVKGKSVIQIQRESLGLTKAAESFGAVFFRNGANMGGVVEVPQQLNETAYKNLKESWNEQYSGLMNSHKTVILEGGAKYNRIGIPPSDAQFLETRKFQVSEVARWFGVQPHLLFDLERSTNNNIEHQGRDFVMYTLAPHIKGWEEEMRRKLFSKNDRKTHFIEFNMNALLRGDSKARAEFYQKLFSVGSITPNRIRRYENLPGYEGGDRYYVQAGYVPAELIDNVYMKNINHEKTTQPNT